jgi:hypothetical protein
MGLSVDSSQSIGRQRIPLFIYRENLNLFLVKILFLEKSIFRKITSWYWSIAQPAAHILSWQPIFLEFQKVNK